MTGNSVPSGGVHTSKSMSKVDVCIGAIILVLAQIAAASTASCVHALPSVTPSVLRGLWRQTLTSIIFSVLTLILFVCRNVGMDHKNACNDVDEDTYDGEIGKVEQEDSSDRRSMKTSIGNDATSIVKSSTADNDDYTSAAARFVLVVIAVVGATLLNDTIVIALEYASSAAVMCLCNTTPIWLILFAIVHCGVSSPGALTIAGASLSLIGAIICATGGESNDDEDSTGPKNESLGAIIATIGGIGGAMYMTACRKLAPVGLHPILLTFIVNVGMATVSFLLCLATLPNGVTIFSKDITHGFFGFLNAEANPAAILHSVFPDCGGNFGIMIALLYFEPLIVSMVMLTEPLNASVIAMNFVGEAPPSRRTIFGVAVVLTGCGVVLWESSKEGKEMSDIERQEEAMPTMEQVERRSIAYRRRTSQTILLSPIGTIAPDATAKAAFSSPGSPTVHRRFTLPVDLMREMSMTALEKQESSRLSCESDPNDSARRTTLTSSILRSLGQRLSFTRLEDDTNDSIFGSLLFRGSATQRYGAIIEEEGEEGASE